MSLITCRDLTLGYDSKPILCDLSFSVESKDYLFIVGENGSGKSTLMKSLLGLVPTMGGQVIFGDGLSHKQIGYLPQQSAIQRDFPASVEEIVLSGCLGRCGARPFYGKAERELARKNIERMGLWDLYKHSYRDLSGGQQQRVLLARALCSTDKLLLMDEPISGLDPKASSDFYALIDELNREDGLTVITISHDLTAALRYATHILHIGKLMFFGTRDEYKKANAKLLNPHCNCSEEVEG
jgi:zinc transport system ATP-binding protein